MTAEQVPAAAAEVFGARLELAVRYHALLATAGIERGLVGPREAPRLWDRHILNCAVISGLLPDSARVVDVGSGAGLPGLVLAIRRPDLHVELVESLQRRTEFLTDAIKLLGLGESVRVVRGRAEDAEVVRTVGATDWVTARAVAPLDRLAGWCLPLLQPGGELLAMKGSGANDEVAQHSAAVRRLGADAIRIVHCGAGVLAEPTTVVSVRRGPLSPRARRGERP